MGSGWFDLNRVENYPSRFPDKRTAAHHDIPVDGIIVAFGIILISSLVVVWSHKGSERRRIFVRIVFSLLIGGATILGNYGHDWEYGKIHFSGHYKPASSQEIQGVLELKIALRGINITLKGTPITHDFSGENATSHNGQHQYEKPPPTEIIDYNEHFSWQWEQGKLGFGYYAGQISRDFREASLHGVPLPILHVAEYFTFDGEGIRFGRHYRLNGWFAHIFMWCAFCTWILSQILFFMVIRKASLFLAFTGFLQLGSVALWKWNRNWVELQIPFQSFDQHHDVLLKLNYGFTFYLVTANGLLCVLLALVIYLFDLFLPDEMCQFFGIDPLTIYEECLVTNEEAKRLEKQRLERKTMKSRMFAFSNVSIEPSWPSPVDEPGTSTSSFKKTVSVLRRKSYKFKPPVAPRKRAGGNKIKLEAISGDRVIKASSKGSVDTTQMIPLLQNEYNNEPEDNDIYDYPKIRIDRRGSTPPPLPPKRRNNNN